MTVRGWEEPLSGETHGRDGAVWLARVETRQGFGRELTALRERASLTIRDVARAVGVPDSTIGGYFSGRHLPPLRPPDQLQKILQVCGVTDPVVIAEWVETLHRVRGRPGAPRMRPFPIAGWPASSRSDAGWFFGRENLIDVVVSHLGALGPRRRAPFRRRAVGIGQVLAAESRGDSGAAVGRARRARIRQLAGRLVHSGSPAGWGTRRTAGLGNGRGQ